MENSLHPSAVSSVVRVRKNRRLQQLYGVWLIIASLIGFIAALQLTLEKIAVTKAPELGASCDFSIIVQCSANLNSWQGSLLGFPNSILGLALWPLVFITGVLALGGVWTPRWYRQTFTLGVTLGLLFVFWLISQSIFDLKTLCPWCLVTWAVMIPTFFSTLGREGIKGTFGARFKGFLKNTPVFTPAAIFIVFFAIALIAQLQLDWLGEIFG